MAELELFWVRIFQRLVKPRFVITGACQSNGQCCHHLLFVEGFLERWPGLRRLYQFWLNGIYRFVATENVVEMPGGRRARIYRCDFLDANRRCRSHRLRPLLCRRYPLPGYFVAANLHRGCGYRVIDRMSGEVCAPQQPEAPGLRGQQTAAEVLKQRWPRRR